MTTKAKTVKQKSQGDGLSIMEIKKPLEVTNFKREIRTVEKKQSTVKLWFAFVTIIAIVFLVGYAFAALELSKTVGPVFLGTFLVGLLVIYITERINYDKK